MDDEMDRLEKIKTNCPKCAGAGVIIHPELGGIYMEVCSCMRKIEREISLIQANIPPRYRNFDLRKITKDFESRNRLALNKIKAYGEKISDNIERGSGIWMYSTPGLGKSSLISWILKKAIDAGHTAYFSRASHLVTKKLEALRQEDSKELIDFIVDKVDILALEEIEKVYLTGHEDFVPNLFFEFLSDLHDAKKAILISSNMDIRSTMQKFPVYIQDRLKEMMLVKFEGKSERCAEGN